MDKKPAAPKPKKSKKPPAQFVQERKNLIVRLLGDNPIDWPRELGISKKLFCDYQSPEFWNSFRLPISFGNITSLALLLSEWGREFLRKSWNAYIFYSCNSASKVELGKEKIGEDLVLMNNTRKSLREFLK